MSLVKDLYHAVIDSAAVQGGAALLARALPTPHIALTRHEVVVPGLPSHLAGLRILHISDLHLRPGSELARELPGLAGHVAHDFALYTGDFIDTDEGIEPVAAILASMPRVEGSFAVLGNHDYRPLGRNTGANDVRRLRAELRGAGIEMLDNAARPIRGGEIFVAGVDDPATRRDDLDRALSAVPPNTCSILLAHSPDIVLKLGAHRPGLILAGHTHGGQIRLPVIGPLHTESRLPRRLAMGLHSYDGIPTYITRGIGYSGINLRVGCPAEVALLTLRSPLAAERAA